MTDLWGNGGNDSDSLSEMWENFGAEYSGLFTDESASFFAGGGLDSVTPSPGIQCMPAPGPFLPCNDLFDWWTLRCSVWIVFLLALLGNGCVVIVLIASRGKMDVPRFLVCNLAMADFCMGLYLGFLAIVDASSIGDFRQMAIHWQFSAGCQVAGFFGVLSSELSVFTLAVITLERNYAITHAMHLNKRLSLKHAAYIMAAGWTFSVLMALMPLVGVSDYRKFAVCLPFETSDPVSLGYVVFLMLINGVAFSILMGCYLKMYCAIRGSQAWNSNDSRIAKRMALLVFTDFICWAPIAFLALTASLGLHLISLETAKVFTIFVLPLNSCCNPFLYAILTKQFKKDCVMICKTIEESRVTRGIGRCRHSSNFSNRQTPANTNSINSGSGGGGAGGAGSHGSHQGHSRGTMCSCNAANSQKGSKTTPAAAAAILASYWPFKKIKKFFHGCKETSDSLVTNSAAFTHQIAEIQHKQRKTKRHASVSSDNFSSSRSDSWRHAAGAGHIGPGGGLHHHHHGLHGHPGIQGRHHYRHRRRNSWTVTRKPSQDSQLSSSRNDSASSNSTNTWRMSRSSVSSEMSNSLGRAGSGRNANANAGSGNVVAGAAAGANIHHHHHHPALTGPLSSADSCASSTTSGGKFTTLAYARARALNNANAAPLLGAGAAPVSAGGALSGGVLKPYKPLPLSRLASENASLLSSCGGSKPKLIRQSAILADGDSTSSGKSVTFKEPLPEEEEEETMGAGNAAAAAAAINSINARGFIAAAAELGQCPLHSHHLNPQQLQLRANVYGKLAELSQEAAAAEEVEEESDMEASDADDDDEEEEDPVSDGLPLGTSFRSMPPPPAKVKPSSAAGKSSSSGGRFSNLIPRKLSQISRGEKPAAAVSHKEADDEEEVDETTPLRTVVDPLPHHQTAAQVLGNSSNSPPSSSAHQPLTTCSSSELEKDVYPVTSSAQVVMQELKSNDVIVSSSSSSDAENKKESNENPESVIEPKSSNITKADIASSAGSESNKPVSAAAIAVSASVAAAEMAEERKSQTEKLKKKFLESEIVQQSVSVLTTVKYLKAKHYH